MNIGMLWFDNNTKTHIAQKIEQAALYYKNKYGHHPNYCFIHPTMVKSESMIDKNDLLLKIKTAPFVLPNHFWLGVEDNSHAPSQEV